MTDNYSTNYMLGEICTVVVGIVNHEHRPVNYTTKVRVENENMLKNINQISLPIMKPWKNQLLLSHLSRREHETEISSL